MGILETDLGGRLASLDLLALVFEASWIVQAVLLLLAVLSVFSWAVIFYKSRELRAAEQDSEAFLEMYHEGSLEDAWKASRDLERSPLAAVFEAAFGDLLRVQRETGRAAPLEAGLTGSLASRAQWAAAREVRGGWGRTSRKSSSPMNSTRTTTATSIPPNESWPWPHLPSVGATVAVVPVECVDRPGSRAQPGRKSPQRM